MGPLGRLTPPDWEHVSRHPLSALAAPPVDVPVVLGVNWYDSFDSPREVLSKAEGKSWHLPDVGKGEDLGSIRGGHCFALEPMGYVKENREAQRVFYDQGVEGACVGFGNSRAQTILRGKLFDAFWLYDEARRHEGTYPDQEGSTVRSAAAVLKAEGLRIQAGNVVCEREVGDSAADPTLGISAYRWATNVDEVLAALARPNAQALPFVNSWGAGYPAVCWLPVATLERLLKEEGECLVATER